MNNKIEKIFVNNFIKRPYKERLLFELKSEKKRLHAIMRFCHNAEEFLKQNTVYSKQKTISKENIDCFFDEKELYVISFKYLNGVLMPIDEVARYLNHEYLPVIVCGINNVIIKNEVEQGNCTFFFLKGNPRESSHIDY